MSNKTSIRYIEELHILLCYYQYIGRYFISAIYNIIMSELVMLRYPNLL